MTLPPELEMQFMDSMQASLKTIQEDYTKFNQAADHYRNINDNLISYNEGMMPEADFIKSFSEQQYNLAGLFQGDAKAAIEAGFMDDDTAKYMGLIDQEGNNLRKELSALEASNFTDPALENDLQKQKQDLEKRLQQGGASPAARAQALRDFERGSTEARFTRAEELRTGKTQRLISGASAVSSQYGQAFQTGMTGKQYNLNRASTGFQAGSQMLNQTQQMLSQQSQLSQTGYSMSGSQVGVNQTLRNGMNQQFAQAGQYQFSQGAKQYLRSSASDPDSVLNPYAEYQIRNRTAGVDSVKSRSYRNENYMVNKTQKEIEDEKKRNRSNAERSYIRG
jgi:hypothetical protein